MAVVFENLKGFPAYWRVFDREKDRGVIVEHMDHHKLSLADMEQVTRELRLWVDGSSEVVKSPRGKLATFVKNHALRKPKDNGQRRISLLETYGLAVPSDGV